MKKRPFALAALISLVVTGIFIWFSSNHNHNNDFTIPFVLSVLLALAVSILTDLPLGKIALATTLGVIIAIIIKIIIDWQFDPTSHNMFPFEIIIDLIFISIASLIGAAIGMMFRGFRKRRIIGDK